MVRATDLEVGYGVAVCAPISLHLRAGEVLAVVGVNGTGKSTLLRTVVGQLDPVQGRVEVLGRPVDERSVEFRAAVAADLGDDVFFPALTVREHLLLTCFGHGVADAPEVVGTCSRSSGSRRAPTRCRPALSSGQRRRLLLAAAFARPRRCCCSTSPSNGWTPGCARTLTDRLVASARAAAPCSSPPTIPPSSPGAATAVLLITEEAVRTLAPAAAAAAIEGM